jgi:hypothetical protein
VGPLVSPPSGRESNTRSPGSIVNGSQFPRRLRACEYDTSMCCRSFWSSPPRGLGHARRHRLHQLVVAGLRRNPAPRSHSTGGRRLRAASARSIATGARSHKLTIGAPGYAQSAQRSDDVSILCSGLAWGSYTPVSRRNRNGATPPARGGGVAPAEAEARTGLILPMRESVWCRISPLNATSNESFKTSRVQMPRPGVTAWPRDN